MMELFLCISAIGNVLLLIVLWAVWEECTSQKTRADANYDAWSRVKSKLEKVEDIVWGPGDTDEDDDQ